ncbi:hypothetical protein NMY22_g12133 [Coprinellus aureogranulatus]|nr:hypothetical protein NMY22_g12133 [Coprinellus aureogranulatus]
MPFENEAEGHIRGNTIDPDTLIPMDKYAFSQSSAPPSTYPPCRVEAAGMEGHSNFNVLFIGAGNIMFGSPEGPWNHSFRLEHKLGPRLKVVGLVDPNTERAKETLAKKCDSFVTSAYKDTRVCKDLDEFLQTYTPNEKPHAAIIGSPPMFRGTMQKGRDIEVQLMKHFPGLPLFVEKPIATGPLDEMDQHLKIAKMISDTQTICSVGYAYSSWSMPLGPDEVDRYMLRYLKAVQMMKKIIEDNNLTVMCTIARYACAYEAIAKPEWWDKSKSAGPVIEQGTHFCDLSRYFGGEVDISTVQAHSLEWDENAGRLGKMAIDESKIPAENRIPRVTSATWKYANGAVGSFSHVVALQGHNYSCELEVYADGYQLKLVDPYVSPILYIRQPGDDTESKLAFPEDDPFFSEISHFIDAVENPEADPQILSSFDDAARTYELTWAIRRASEKSRDELRARQSANKV